MLSAATQNPAAERFQARFRRVLEFIDAHLDERLTLERLSEVAAFSQFHFHREFSELFGIGTYQYLQLVRLHRAAYRLAYRPEQSVTSIAHDSGYDGSDAFARAFRKRLGQSPSEFRQQPDWTAWHAMQHQLSELRNRHMSPSHLAQAVEIVHFEPVRVAVLEHRGPPDRLGESIRRFIAWRKQHRLPPHVSATFNIAYDDPETTEPAQFRFDLCAAIDRDPEADDSGIVLKEIPGGRCARLRHRGPEATLGQSIRYLYGAWLPASGEEPRDFPLFLQRVVFFPDVPEHEAVTDIYLPLQGRP